MNLMITSQGLQDYLRLSNDALFPLPSPALTHVTDILYRDNWWMHTAAHLALCRTTGGRPMSLRLTARGDPRGTVYPREERQQEEEQRQLEDMEHEQTQQEAGYFEGGTSGAGQQEKAQTGGSAQYTGGMSPEQWGVFQAFMDRQDAFIARQEAHNQRVDERFESQQRQLDTLAQRVRRLGVNVGEITGIGTKVMFQHQREFVHQQWSRSTQAHFYDYLRSHPGIRYPEEIPPPPPKPIKDLHFTKWYREQQQLEREEEEEEEERRARQRAEKEKDPDLESSGDEVEVLEEHYTGPLYGQMKEKEDERRGDGH